jgi:class 3 adenylate cyclase
MFVDIMGASEVSNHKNPAEYAKFVNSFQKLFMSVCKKYTDAWYDEDSRKEMQYSSRGDEGLLMIYRSETLTDPTVDIDVAINIALELKRQWLCSDVNKDRINSGLLPVDLAIGIHIGRTYLEKIPSSESTPRGNPGGWLPEGYAINLAKRVESHSRQGRFSHILLSEAAQGQLNYLANERTYLFDDPQVISPKGISRDIRVYEIKHHFLPTDWAEESEQSRRAKTLLDPKSVDVGIISKALSINPTNLWMAEEFIRSSVLQNYYGLKPDKREDTDSRREAFKEAQARAGLLAQGDQRDAGVLFIQGLVEGECDNGEIERKLYEEAIKFREQLAEAFWYKGLSFSMEVYDRLKGDSSKPLSQIPKELQELVPQAVSYLKQAKTMRSQAAWMLYDYASEIIRWSEDDSDPRIAEGISDIVAACHALPEIRDKIESESYLDKVRSHPAIKKLLADEK